MALEMRSPNIDFDFTRGGIQKLQWSETFSRPVRAAECAVKAFDIKYRSGSDHPLHRMIIDIDGPSIGSNRAEVKFTIEMGLRDASGTWDDEFGGRVQVLVIADTE